MLAPATCWTAEAALQQTCVSPGAGSKWPKTSIGCLRDGRRLTPEQLATLCRICRQALLLLLPLAVDCCTHFLLPLCCELRVPLHGLVCHNGSPFVCHWVPYGSSLMCCLYTALRACSEESAAFQQLQQQAAAGNGAAAGAAAALGPAVAVDSACIALFECRSLERLLSCRHVDFQGEQPSERKDCVACSGLNNPSLRQLHLACCA